MVSSRIPSLVDINTVLSPTTHLGPCANIIQGTGHSALQWRGLLRGRRSVLLTEAAVALLGSLTRLRRAHPKCSSLPHQEGPGL